MKNIIKYCSLQNAFRGSGTTSKHLELAVSTMRGSPYPFGTCTWYQYDRTLYLPRFYPPVSRCLAFVLLEYLLLACVCRAGVAERCMIKTLSTYTIIACMQVLSASSYQL